MKKFSLMGVLLLFIIGTIGCESAVHEMDYDNEANQEIICEDTDCEKIDLEGYAIVTGKIVDGRPPHTLIQIVIPRVVNEAGSFVLLKNGEMITHTSRLESDHSIGDIITIRGKVSEGECAGEKFYFLEIIEIIE